MIMNVYLQWDKVRKEMLETLSKATSITDDFKMGVAAIAEQDLFIIAGALAVIADNMEENNGKQTN